MFAQNREIVVRIPRTEGLVIDANEDRLPEWCIVNHLRKTTLQLTALLALAINLAGASQGWSATITYNDGFAHTISTTESSSFSIYDGPSSATTTLEFVPGASLYLQLINLYQHSHLEVQGGSLYAGVTARDDSTINVSGGSVTGVASYLYNQASFQMSGGIWDYLIVVQGSTGSATITDGTLSAIENRSPTAVIDIYKAFIPTSTYNGLYATYGGVINIHGRNLQLTNTGELQDGYYPKWQLNGQWADGTPIATTYVYFHHISPGTVNLIDIPEPSALLSLSAGASLLFTSRSQWLRGMH